jgi:hypothetical protein
MKYLILVFLIIIILVGGCNLLIINTTKSIVVATVEDKERVTTKEDSKYLIYTDKETFKIVDELLVGNFSSSDLYGHIKRDKKYKFTVTGWRIPFFSSYRNIIKVEEYKEEKKIDKPKDVYSTWYLKDTINE